MGEAAARLGPPLDAPTFNAENVAFYDYVFAWGPEGSHRYTFGYNAEIGSPDDPGPGEGLDAMVALTFSAEQ